MLSLSFECCLGSEKSLGEVFRGRVVNRRRFAYTPKTAGDTPKTPGGTLKPLGDRRTTCVRLQSPCGSRRKASVSYTSDCARKPTRHGASRNTFGWNSSHAGGWQSDKKRGRDTG
jgi:hypothetical protein